jgi:ankyrin repeat protein
VSLVYAIYARNEWLVRYLIDHGADVNARGRSMGSALGLAASLNVPAIAKMLIDAGADLNVDALKEAVDKNHGEIALMLLQVGATIPKSEHLLSNAIHKRNSAVALALIARGADLNERTKIGERDKKTRQYCYFFSYATPLMVAAASGQEEIVEALIGAGADLYLADVDGATALEHATRNGQAGAAQRIQAAMAKVPRNVDPEIDLIYAASKGDGPTVRQLLAAGVKVDTRDVRPRSNGFTPLMLAAQAGHLEIVRMLLDQGFELRFLRPQEEILRTAQLLIAAGAAPSVKDKNNESAIDRATRSLKESDFYRQLLDLFNTAQPATAKAPVAAGKVKPEKRSRRGRKKSLQSKLQSLSSGPIFRRRRSRSNFSRRWLSWRNFAARSGSRWIM